MSTVFISYRRADSAHWAGKLHEHVGLRFGRDLVFRDVEDITPGADFLTTLRRALARSRVFLALIGPHWVQDATGRHRLDDPRDVLRMELTLAQAAHQHRDQPGPGGAAMPPAGDLPRPLRPLVRRQAVTLRGTRWARDVGALIEVLRETILPTAQQLPLARALRQLRTLQSDYFERLDPRPAAALDLTRKTQAYLDRALPLYPQDPDLKVTRGYLFKNEAMALIRLEREPEARRALAQGERVFRTMLRERRRDAAAWNGRGSVAAVRADLERARGRLREARQGFREALGHIDRALRIHPRYDAALTDRAQVRARLRDLR